MSLMLIENRCGEIHDPYWMWTSISLVVNCLLSIVTWKVRLSNNEPTIFTNWCRISIISSMYRRPSYYTLSKVYSISNSVAAVLYFMFVLFVILSIRFVSWMVVLCWDLNPNCLGWIFSVIWILRRLSNSFSNAFPIVFSSDIGRWFFGVFRSIPGFRIIVIEALLYALGKYSNLAQQLYIR